MVHVLITGVAGLIGAALAELLTARGDLLFGTGDLNSYCSISLKRDRLSRVATQRNGSSNTAKWIFPEWGRLRKRWMVKSLIV